MKQNCVCPNAIANIRGSNEFPNISGQIKFYQKSGYVLVEANIRNLPFTETCFFGFHIHEGKNCGGDNFANTGNHYNPAENPHPCHAGDLPPLMLCNTGAYLSVATDRFRASDIIGKTVVIHNMPDDFSTQPSGDAGEKIACGVIRKI